MPPFWDWIGACWSDYRRLWGRLMTVLGVAGAATLAAVALPLIPTLILAVMRIGPPWVVVGVGATASLTVALWASSWGQAAALRAVRYDEPAADSLSRAWPQTAAFGWVVTLTFLAMGGGYCLFVLPGVALTVLLFFAPYYEISGEGVGTEALGLSWARVAARPGDAVVRLLAALILAWAPSQIPLVGWLIAMVWAPFGLVATSRLADDLRAASPDARSPEWMGRAVAGLSAVLLVGLLSASLGAVYLARRALPMASGMAGRLMAGGIDPASGRALLAVAQGTATPEQKRQAYDFAVAASSAAWNADVSSAPMGSLWP
ncbi:MAG: hypothetical protein HKL90_11165 [Elusimicrobia bacterium]|nr:hypothetical protein [Elusimicrobiota bacterium]